MIAVGAFLISSPIDWIILEILTIFFAKIPCIFDQLAFWGIIALAVVGVVTAIALLGFILPIVISLLPFSSLFF
ncbi:hypothetical protein J1907_06345 [Lysinibacillus sphaericus]|uniref:hypothetical protein n=1 Tax=Lysinibacillus sphaericus TaxID=1421 RepID=UPI00055FEFF8|nr:hypothetical protein [Lysinibacillus sphaericus]MBG9755848.1 hypothetical protein [Lysinibacillus sphaericus]QTB14780.1 hypothetical protein J2B92_06045 [Lysinibacillus sphaericus]QTB23698.1 hypothetical protein J1907_06345 [Lysinibacillus sphaericus]